MKKNLLAVIFSLVMSVGAYAQTDLNMPFGWVNCSSMTLGDDYKTTGGSGLVSPRVVTLKNEGEGYDMRNLVLNAINNNDIIILDGSNGDFIFSKSIDIEKKSDKTIVGINGARLCTKFQITDEMKQSLDADGVKNASTASGTGGMLSNGVTVSEECEYLTRQILIDITGDKNENHRKAGIFNITNCNNIIIRNIVFQGPGACDVSGYDLISANGDTHLWVDHCEFVDGIDGNFDLTKETDLTTVSWCKFSYTTKSYNHMNSNLVGSSDSYTKDENKLNITFAYNMWGEKCNQRMPMARFGTIHLLNNYYNCPGASLCINPRKSSEFLIEGNYAETNVKKVFSSSSAKAYVFKSNVFKSASTPSNVGSVTLPYRYNAVSAETAKAEVIAHVGATLADPLSIEGVNTDIQNVIIGCVDNNVCYNMQGQRVSSSHKGITICNGRKYVNR